MLRWILLAVVVIALSATATLLIQYAPDSDSSAALAVSNVTGPHPTAEVVEPLVYDFGTMPHESKGAYSWEIKNVGEARLDLWLEGKTTCHGCVKIQARFLNECHAVTEIYSIRRWLP